MFPVSSLNPVLLVQFWVLSKNGETITGFNNRISVLVTFGDIQSLFFLPLSHEG